MKCPWCGVWTEVVRTDHGRRTRVCANGHRFKTVEVSVQSYDYMQLQRNLRAARATLRRKGYLR